MIATLEVSRRIPPGDVRWATFVTSMGDVRKVLRPERRRRIPEHKRRPTTDLVYKASKCLGGIAVAIGHANELK